MKRTILDKLIESCLHLRTELPIMAHMYDILKATAPVSCLLGPKTGACPVGPDMSHPFPAYCLDVSATTEGRGLTAMTLDGMAESPELPALCEPEWRLEGLLVFDRGEGETHVVGVRYCPKGDLAFPDMQIVLRSEDGKVEAAYAEVGPVNRQFYDYFLQRSDNGLDIEKFKEYAGDCSGLLGGWLSEISGDGQWVEYPPKPPRMVSRGGGRSKVVEAVRLGYRMFQPYNGEENEG